MGASLIPLICVLFATNSYQTVPAKVSEHHSVSPKTAPVEQKPVDYFGNFVNDWSKNGKVPLYVNNNAKVSGVTLFTTLEGKSRIEVLKATASVFSHLGAVSYWSTDEKPIRFVLSANYGRQLDKTYWSQKLMDLFQSVKKYSGASEEEKLHMIQASQEDKMLKTALESKSVLNCVQLMDAVFNEKEINAIIAGEKSPVLKISNLSGNAKDLAQKLYDENIYSVSNKNNLSNEPELQFSMYGSEDEITKRLFVYSPLKDGTSVGTSFLGFFAEESARNEIKNFWLVRGDKQVILPEKPKRDTFKKIEIKYGTYQEKLSHISKVFNVPIIAVIPQVRTSNELYIGPTLGDTLACLSDGREPFLFKMREGILLACPSSFLGDKGVSSALPLTTIRALIGADKSESQICAVIANYRNFSKIDDAQIDANATHFPYLTVIKQWRDLLSNISRNKNKASKLSSGEAITIDAEVAATLNRIIDAEHPGKNKRVVVGDKLQLQESYGKYPPQSIAFPEGVPQDYIIPRIVELKCLDYNGKVGHIIRNVYPVVNPIFSKSISVERK